MGFLILVCGKCGRPSLAREENRSRRCPYCGSLVKITRLNVVASAEDAETARELLKNIKLRRGRIRETRDPSEYY
ncbi:MAG: DUF1922 domain-containing protein [Candidatus Bathyarchaeia archaeon]|nr:DUF1922 domain-containing protein [Candidatus Bathyarchaeota archaeon]